MACEHWTMEQLLDGMERRKPRPYYNYPRELTKAGQAYEKKSQKAADKRQFNFRDSSAAPSRK
jgi:hypothetical protein